MGLAAIGSTLYSVLAAHWPHDRAAFERSCQRGLEAVFVLGGVAVATVLAGAEFFTGLLGAELVPAGTALRVLTILALAKAFSMTLGPTLLVVKAQAQVLKLILIATAAKAVVLAVVAPKFGFMGVAWGALTVEVCAVVVPSIFIIKRLTGVSVKWRTPLYALGVSAASVLLAVMLFPAGSVYAAAAAGVFYVLLVLANGTVNPSEIRMLLRRAPVGEPAVTTAGGDSPGDD
jgi:O-antigen/teichoic acid export membrane protein